MSLMSCHGMIIAQCSRVRVGTALYLTSSSFVVGVRKYGETKNDVPELTRIRYPGVQRGNYAQLQKGDVLAFNNILDQNRVITDVSDLEGN